MFTDFASVAVTCILLAFYHLDHLDQIPKWFFALLVSCPQSVILGNGELVQISMNDEILACQV